MRVPASEIDRMKAIGGLHACLGVLETEALDVDLRSVARFLRLARLEIEAMHGFGPSFLATVRTTRNKELQSKS